MKKVVIGCSIAAGIVFILFILLIVIIITLSVVSKNGSFSAYYKTPDNKKVEIYNSKNKKQPQAPQKIVNSQEKEVINLAKDFITSIDNKEYAYIYNDMLVKEFKEQYSYEKVRQILAQTEKLGGLVSIDTDNAVVKIENGINATPAEININAKYTLTTVRYTIKAVKNGDSFKIHGFKFDSTNTVPSNQPKTGLSFNVPLPGESMADQKLQYDTLSNVYIVAGAKVQNCGNMSVIDTKVTKSLSGVKYNGSKPIAGNWEEVWTVNACSQKLDIPISFSLDETGASFSVRAR